MAAAGGKTAYLFVVIIYIIYAGYYVLCKVAFDDGMNTSVFVFYRQAAASIFLAPIALLSAERKTALPLSFMLSIKIFLLALLGITVSLNFYTAGLKYITASLSAAMSNSMPVFTFFIAFVLRMEKVNLRRSSGYLKLGGIGLCLGGAIIVAIYKGPHFNLLQHHHLFSHHIAVQDDVHHHPHNLNSTTNNSWIIGVSLVFLSNFFWGLWLVLQAKVLESYTSKLTFTTLQCFFSTFQSFLVAIAMERDPSGWKLGWDVRLLSVAYAAIVVTGVTFYLQAWVIEKKGPVFLAMMTPLDMIFTVLVASVLFGEIVSLGSVIGTVLLLGGLYSVLWGQAEERRQTEELLQSNKSDPTITIDSSSAAAETKTTTSMGAYNEP